MNKTIFTRTFKEYVLPFLKIALWIITFMIIIQVIMAIPVQHKIMNVGKIIAMLGLGYAFVRYLFLNSEFAQMINPLGKNGFNKKIIIRGIGLGILIFVINIISASSLPVVPTNQQVIEKLISSNMMPTLFYTIGIAPVLEELLFRTSVQEILFKNKKTVGWLFSAIMFGAFHANSWQSFLAYAAFGLPLSIVYAYSRDIRLTTIGHGVNNLLSQGLSVVQTFLS